MVLSGRVHNGVVILDGEADLSEGTAVTVYYYVADATSSAAKKTRIEVPLVRTGQPDAVNLTGERIADIMDEQDAAGCSPR